MYQYFVTVARMFTVTILHKSKIHQTFIKQKNKPLIVTFVCVDHSDIHQVHIELASTDYWTVVAVLDLPMNVALQQCHDVPQVLHAHLLHVYSTSGLYALPSAAPFSYVHHVLMHDYVYVLSIAINNFTK
jgi:hypothetical protein